MLTLPTHTHTQPNRLDPERTESSASFQHFRMVVCSRTQCDLIKRAYFMRSVLVLCCLAAEFVLTGNKGPGLGDKGERSTSGCFGLGLGGVANPRLQGRMRLFHPHACGSVWLGENELQNKVKHAVEVHFICARSGLKRREFAATFNPKQAEYGEMKENKKNILRK